MADSIQTTFAIEEVREILHGDRRGALCAKQHEEWSTGRRYLNMDEYFGWKSTPNILDEKLPKAA